jgi:hypothetical protein
MVGGGSARAAAAAPGPRRVCDWPAAGPAVSAVAVTASPIASDRHGTRGSRNVDGGRRGRGKIRCKVART